MRGTERRAGVVAVAHNSRAMRGREPKPSQDPEHQAPQRHQSDPHPDERLIDAHLRLSPAERLKALQSFVDDVIRMRRGRRPPVR